MLTQIPDSVVSFIDESFDSSIASNCSLFMQLDETGIAYTIFDNKRGKYVALQQIIFDDVENESDLQSRIIKEVRANNLLLTASFAKVGVSIKNKFSTLIPAALYSSADIKDYIRFHFQLNDDYVFQADYIKDLDAYNVFAVKATIAACFKNLFKDANIHHYNTSLLTGILQLSVQQRNTAVYLDVVRDSFVLSVAEGDKLLLTNTFEYATPEDFLYFVLYAMQQLKLNQEHTPLVLSGNIHPSGELYAILKKFVSNITFAEHPHPDVYSYGFANVAPHYFYSLLNQHQCES